MPENPLPPKKPKRSRWLRRIGKVFLWLLVGLVVLYYPLVHFAVPWIAARVLAGRGLNLAYDSSGSVFSSFHVKDLELTANEGATLDLAKLKIGNLDLEYSLGDLMQKGAGEFLGSVRAKNVEIVVTPKERPKKPKDDTKLRRPIVEEINRVLTMPGLYSRRVEIENLNLRVERPGETLVIEGLDALFDPEKPGWLRADRVAIPGFTAWENVTGATAYEGRRIVISDLRLDEQLVVTELEFDPRQRAVGGGETGVQLALFGGSLAARLKSAKIAEGEFQTDVTASAQGINLTELAKYFRLPNLPVQTLESMKLEFEGNPERPQSWDAKLSVVIPGADPGAIEAGRSVIDFTAKDGQAQAQVVVAIGDARINVAAHGGLPEGIKELPSTSAKADFSINAPSLAEIGAALDQPVILDGALLAEGKADWANNTLQLEAKVDATGVMYGDVSLGSGAIALQASKVFPKEANPEASPLAELTAEIKGQLERAGFGTFSADAASFDAGLAGQRATLRSFKVERGANSVTANGTYELPADMKAFDKAPADVRFMIAAPELREFGISAGGEVLNGAINGSGSVRIVSSNIDGEVAIEGGGFSLGEFEAQRLVIKAKASGGEIEVDEILLQINEQDRVAIAGKMQMEKPNAYAGAVLVRIQDLKTFQPLLKVFGQEQEIAGDISLELNSEGEIDAARHEGTLSLNSGGVSYGKTQINAIRVEGRFTPELAETTELFVSSGPTSLRGTLEWEAGKLRLKDIDLRQGEIRVLSGFVIVPFRPDTPENLIPMDDRIAVNVNATDLDIGPLLESFKVEAPVTGRITANLLAGGTLLAPSGNVKVTARGLVAKAASQLQPAELDLSAFYAEKSFSVNAIVRQPQIQPLTIQGKAPVDLEATIKSGKLDPDLPIEASVHMPASSLAVVRQFSDQVRRLDGNVAIDVTVGGTVGAPVLGGEATLNISSLRLNNPQIPAVSDFSANLAFARDTLTVRRFRGVAGGGTFGAGGSIKLEQLTAPVFDLRVQSDDVLVLRDEAVTVRADTDIRLQGPLASATLSGDVWITQSRFFKEIEILPIGLPGRAKPVPKTAPKQGQSMALSFPDPPLRDWKFNVAIRTRTNDSFRILGNLAKGEVAIDLLFGGTGLEPWLDGSIRVDQFTATLPFSSLALPRGFVTFSRDNPFQPSLDLQAESKIRDYTINAYVYGKLEDPQVQLTSEPPLPHADIVSLLATGATASELGGNADVIASRAAILALQSLYRKIFKKGEPPPDQQESAAKFLDRFDLELGSVDNRTGAREVTARFRINDQFYVIGDLDTGGRYTGSLKYLIRFR